MFINYPEGIVLAGELENFFVMVKSAVILVNHFLW